MIRCVILDDELLAISYLKLLCDQMEGIEVVKAFNNPKLFIQEIDHIDCDVCILDIEMPGMNGLQVAEIVKNRKIIFTTAYKEYAAEAFDLDVVDYVRKPIQKERLVQAFEKVSKLLNEKPKNQFLEWNSNLGKSKIYIDDIVFIKTSEIDSRDKELTLKNNTELTLKNLSFKHLSELLPQKNFVQINKKEMINIDYVKVFSTSEVILNLTSDERNSIKLTVSEVFRSLIAGKLSK